MGFGTKRGPAPRAEESLFDPSTMSGNKPGLRLSGLRLGGKSQSMPEDDEGNASASKVHVRTAVQLTQRSQSMPVEHDFPKQMQQLDESASSSKGRVRTTLRRPRMWERSQSLPVEKVEGADFPKPQQDDSTGSGSKRKIRRRLSLEFLRRRLSRTKDGAASEDVDSCKGEGSTSEESREGALSDFHEESTTQSLDNLLMQRTQVVPHQTSPRKQDDDDISVDPRQLSDPSETLDYYFATAILQHSYLERICGADYSVCEDPQRPPRGLPEDPTVQESIECIFASQLEDGLCLWDEEDEEEERDEFESLVDKPEGLMSPATLLQSRSNRCDRSSSTLLSQQSRKRYQTASLTYVGAYDPTISEDDRSLNEDPLPCPCATSQLPSLNPKDWPQAPLLLRPTPGSNTRIKGVRFGNAKNYFWEPDSHLSWSESLAQTWGVPWQTKPRTRCCEKCAILPINNGNEKHGESLVIDFETDLFEGSLLLRLRFSEGSTREPYDDSKGYFSGVNRRYQAIVRGRFKKEIPLTELVTGFRLKRSCGKLPPKWILRGGLKVISFFAPQLQAKFEGDQPYSLTPLGSAPQVIRVDNEETDHLEDNREEPTAANITLLGESSLATSSLQRARARKKAFDRLYAKKSKEPKADPSKIYSFEFLQHLFNFQEFSIELGSMLGSVELEDILAGQPLQVMASHGDIPLWSFDIWHSCLWEKAQKHNA
jgi:hypothetical protein